MRYRVGVGRTWIEALPDHHHRFAMIRVAGSDPLDVSGQSHITRGLFPDEVERIRRVPDVLPAAGDAIRALHRIIGGFDTGRSLADTALVTENANGFRLSERHAGH